MNVKHHVSCHLPSADGSMSIVVGEVIVHPQMESSWIRGVVKVIVDNYFEYYKDVPVPLPTPFIMKLNQAHVHSYNGQNTWSD